MRLPQEMDSMMSLLHSQINRAISTAITERVTPEIQNIVSSISSSGNRDTEASSSPNSPRKTLKRIKGLKTKLRKGTHSLLVTLEHLETIALTVMFPASAKNNAFLSRASR